MLESHDHRIFGLFQGYVQMGISPGALCGNHSYRLGKNMNMQQK